MKKIKEVFETGGGSTSMLTSLNNSAIIGLTFLGIYSIIVIVIFLFFEPSKLQKNILIILGVILALLAVSIRVFGLRGWRKLLRSRK